jgi:ABC-type lipoprotein release transport system permease subunit
MVAAVDPTLEPAASTIASDDARVAGAYLRPRDAQALQNAPADIYIGATLAKTLALSLNDRVVLTMNARGHSRPTSAAFRVRGIFHTGISELDGFYVEIPLREGQRLLDVGGGVTQVAVLVDQLGEADRVASQLRSRLKDTPDVQVLTWKEGLRELYEAILLDDLGLYLMMAIIFVIVALGIFNTILMSVVERTRELGVMMAVGTSGRRLFATVMVESLILGVVSAAVGLAIGLSIHFWLASHGLDLGSLYGEDMEMAGIVFKGRVYSYLTVGVVAKWTAVVIGLVVGSAVYPALRAARLNPVEAMRHV